MDVESTRAERVLDKLEILRKELDPRQRAAIEEPKTRSPPDSRLELNIIREDKHVGVVKKQKSKSGALERALALKAISPCGGKDISDAVVASARSSFNSRLH